ncbi:hypothetical protein BH18ACT8_BH18ACT8_09340 [soil metagenome]
MTGAAITNPVVTMVCVPRLAGQYRLPASAAPDVSRRHQGRHLKALALVLDAVAPLCRGAALLLVLTSVGEAAATFTQADQNRAA